MAKAKTAPADDAEEEADEKPFESSLTPLGQKALSGYKSRFGEEQGEDKFKQALQDGRLDKAKMVKTSTSGSPTRG